MANSKLVTKKISERGEFLANRQILENAKARLKEEFIGIDQIIDELIRQISSWFLFPELIESPYIINLWGMTGVGKTALVNRIVELIGCSEGYARFNLGTSLGSWVVNTQELETIANHQRKIICFDEFQNSRTIDQNGNEKDSYRSNIIWDLVDSGRISHFESLHGGRDLVEIFRILTNLVQKGVTAKNGKVVKKKNLYKEEMSRFVRYFKESDHIEEIRFFPENFIESLIDSSGFSSKKSIQSFKLITDTRNYLDQLNEKETIDFLRRFIKEQKIGSQNEINLSNSLVLIAGNLDEAFDQANDFNTEIDADEFYKNSLKIDVLKIKEALKHRFRPEQIARLGNNHIIYPAINKSSYQQIIENNLQKISNNFFREKCIKLKFSDCFKQLIYDEGVFPTQGIRPVFSTINQIVKSNLGAIYEKVMQNRHDIKQIILRASTKQIDADYIAEKKQVFSHSFPVTLVKVKKVKPKPDEKQALIAVHEAGHAIAIAILKKKIPLTIRSRPDLPGVEGYTHSANDDRIPENFRGIVEDTVVLLSGIAAEKMIFGKKMTTPGSGSDIKRATEMFMNAFAGSGLGKEKAFFVSDWQKERLIHNLSEIEGKAREYLIKSYRAARILLKREKRLLLEVSAWLSQNDLMTRETFLNDFFNKFSSKWGFDKFHQKQFSYRRHLNEMLNEVRKSEHDQIHKIKLLNNNSSDEVAA